jgi:dTDP-4-amino-4,6-dideoxygalactose transaminase
MLALLERRLGSAPEKRIEARARAGRALLHAIGGALVCPGASNARHSFWLFPVLSKDPPALIAALRREGFDAAPLVSVRAVRAPADRPELEPVVAGEFLSQVVMLPCYAAMGAHALEREAAALRRVASSGA